MALRKAIEDAETTVRRPLELLRPADGATGLRTPDLPGLIRIETDPRKTRLWAVYDVRHTDYATVVQALEKAGFALDGGWWSRRRLAWYRFQDINIRDNASHRPACCSKPPPGAAPRRRG
jgi:hypothetical protein